MKTKSQRSELHSAMTWRPSSSHAVKPSKKTSKTHTRYSDAAGSRMFVSSLIGSALYRVGSVVANHPWRIATILALLIWIRL